MSFKLIEYNLYSRGDLIYTKYKIYYNDYPTFGYELDEIEQLFYDYHYTEHNTNPLYDSLYCNVKILIECSTREEINQYLLDRFAEEIL